MKMKMGKFEPFVRQGFTIIELLVVMAIIGILASVVLVSITNNRKRARKSAALQAAHSALPLVTKCYLEDAYSNNPSAVPEDPATTHKLTPGGTAFSCTGTTNIVPALPTGCHEWRVIEENWGDVRNGSLAAMCDVQTIPGGYNRIPNETYDVVCYYAGAEAGKCKICDWVGGAAWACN